MAHVIKNGRNIKIKGSASSEIKNLGLPKLVAVQPPDFKGIKPKVMVKVGDSVQVGTPLVFDKNNEEVKICSPASGKVAAINRGDKRALLEIVVDTDGEQSAVQLSACSSDEVKQLGRETVLKRLIDGGMFAAIRQRPFSKFAHQEDTPKSIFVHAMSTEPLACNIDIALEGKNEDFQAGLDALTNLTEGVVNLCISVDAKSSTLLEAKNVDIHRFSGPHPAGNVSTHIHTIDPINKGEIVWYIEAQDVVRIGSLLTKGVYPTERVVAVTGEGAAEKYHARTVVGAPIKSLTGNSDLASMRCISGSVLSGRQISADGYVGFYDSQITIIPEGGDRKLLGWLVPGFGRYTFSHTYASAFLPQNEFSLDADENGGHRAIVLNSLYDSYVALDIMTYFLVKAVYAGDLDLAEKLGILECDPEDFALATFACPSKFNVGDLIAKGLEQIEKEG